MTDISAVQQSTRAEVAEYLRDFADQLDTRETDPLTGGLYDESGERPDASGGSGEADEAPEPVEDRVTLFVGNDSATINPPETVGFGVEVTTDEPLVSGETERHVDLELTWDASAVEDDDTLEIE